MFARATLVVTLVATSIALRPGIAVASTIEFTHFAPAGWSKFVDPYGVAVAPDGSIWVTDDVGGHAVHKLSPEGNELLTIGTMGVLGAGDGQFNRPTGIALTRDGQRVYVVEAAGRRVQVFDKNGNFLFKFGSSGSGAGQMTSAFAISVGATGTVYVSESASATTGLGRRVQVFDADGNYQWYFGASGTGNGQFSGVLDLWAADSGDIYVLDVNSGTNTARVQRFSAEGVWQQNIGVGQLTAQARGLFVDGESRVYVAELGQNRVRRFGTDGNLIDEWVATGAHDIAFSPGGQPVTIDKPGDRVMFWTQPGASAALERYSPQPATAPGAFSGPRAVATASNGSIYVADTANNRVQKLAADGSFISVATTYGAGVQLASPRAVAVEPPGTVLVATGGRIVRYTSNLTYVDDFGAGTIGTAAGIAVTSSGRIFVTDAARNCVHEFSAGGAAVTRWPSDDTSGSAPGDFSGPRGVAVAGSSLWVVDSGNNRLQRLSFSGSHQQSVSTFPAGGTLFNQPSGAAVASDGTIWVTDTGGHRVHRLTAAGVADGFWGGPSAGVGTNKFNAPEGIAAGPGGEIYVADTGNSRLMRAIALPPDTTPPAITVSGVPSGWVAGPVSVTVSASDDGVPTPVLYSLNGSEPSIPVTGPVTVSAEGTTTLRYSSTDAAGNKAEGSSVIRIDKTAPVISHDAPEEWQATAVTVNLTAVDAASGVDYIEYRLPDAEGWVRGSSFTVTAEGESLVEVRAVDKVGNVHTKTVPVRIDSSGIVITHNIPSGWVSSPWRVELSAPEGVALYWGLGIYGPVNLYEDGFLVEDEGITRVNFAAMRPDEMLGPMRGVDVMIDRSTPWVWADVPSQPVKGPVTVNIGADDLHSGVVYIEYRANGGLWTSGSAVVLTTEGANVIEYRAMDGVGLWSDVGSATVIIDNTAPDASDDAPPGWVNGPVQLNLSIQGDGYILYSLDGSVPSRVYSGPITLTAEKVHRVRYVARDAVGNVGPHREALVRIDDTAPTVTHSAKASYEGTASFSIAATDTLSGVGSLAYSVNGGSWVHAGGATVQVSVSTVGSHTVEYRALDGAGNERTGRIDFSVTAPPPPPVDPDTVPPVTVASLEPDPQGGWASGAVTLTLSATDASSAVAATYYSVDGGDDGLWETYEAPIRIDTDGVWDIEYHSVDEPGNREPVRRVTVKVDRSAPTKPGVPLVSEVTTRSVRLSWTASFDAASGVDHYRIIDEEGRVWTSTDRHATLTGLVPGAVKTVVVRAVDKAGNESAPVETVASLPYIESQADLPLGNGVVAILPTERIGGVGTTGDARVRFGSVDRPGVVRLSRIATPPVAPPPGLRQFGPGAAISFDGEVSGQRALVLPVDARLPHGRATGLVGYSRINGQWQQVAGFYSDGGRTLTFYPTTFATIWIFEPATVSTAARFSGTSAYKVDYGVSARVMVRLTDPAGEALSGYTVVLQRRTASGWTRVGAMAPVSGEPGAYALSTRPYGDTRTEYRAVLERTALYSATGSTIVVLPKAKLTRPKVPSSTVRRGATFISSGRMYPGHRGVVGVHFERRTPSGWRSEKFVKVTSASDGTWRVRTAVPKAGSWRVRATHLDVGHQASTSQASVSMTVR